MATHTPGPWEVNERGDCVSGTYVGESSGFMFVLAERPHSGYGRDVFAANARLIAAAPEMLEALESCFKWMEFTITELSGHKQGARMNWGGPVSKARAAIAKAKGVDRG